MINWRNGKGGFVGGFKHAIKGLFQFAYSITSERPVLTEPATFAVFGRINKAGIGVLGIINPDGQSVEVSQISNFAVSGRIRRVGQSVEGNIDPDGQSVIGKIQE